MALRLKKDVLTKYQESVTPSRGNKILLVDDEKENLDSLSLILDKDYELMFASDGEEALEVIRQLPSPDDIQMIIADQRMPRLTGVGLFEIAKDLVPDAVRIILTGFSDADAIISSINEGEIYKFLMKPVDPNDLRVTVRRSLEFYQLQRENLKLVVDLQKRVVEVENMVKTFEKFVPRQFLQRVAREGIQNVKNLEIGKAESDVVTILFADIRSFTSLSESIEPQEVLNFLNELFQKIGEPVHQNNGFVDKFIGDSIMALFESPDGTVEMHALNAVRAAVGMKAALAQFNDGRVSRGLDKVEIGIGVHTGPVTIGTVGVESRMDLTVLGDSVNLAARLEQLNKEFGTTIIISHNTYEKVEELNEFDCVKLKSVRVKGRADECVVYEVKGKKLV
ncbi:MAG TPA: adenylate/guanylate cyclase domain-containing response regulator [Verrucomicrobiales bacterium]|nr:adenylate/guanylate cyclase domain-containing response regulator [Verrucomicrobiales bacterium]